MNLILSAKQPADADTIFPPVNRSIQPPLAVGFVAQPGHLMHDEFVALALAPNIRKIVLERSNLIEMYVSLKKASGSQKWYGVDTTATRVSVKPEALRVYMRMIESHRRCLAAARRRADEMGGGSAWLTHDYDELSAEGERGAAVLAGLYAHLGVPPVPDPRLLGADQAAQGIRNKQNYARLNESISNYGELWKALAKEPRYQAMLGQEPPWPGSRVKTSKARNEPANPRVNLNPKPPPSPSAWRRLTLKLCT